MPFGSNDSLLIGNPISFSLFGQQYIYPAHKAPSGVTSLVAEDGTYIFEENGVDQLIGEV
jgi:hypothetical protein